MGRALAAEHPVARRTFERANDILGYDIARLCFEGPREQLALTEHCQPAVLTTSVAALRVAREMGLCGDLTMGHSLGEYAALVASGSFGFDETLRVVRERGVAATEVARQTPGSMAAVLGASDGEVEEICAEAGDVWPANYNCPGQVVASGRVGAIERMMEIAGARGIKTRLLEIDGAFHSRLMAPAADRLREALRQVRIQTPCVPFLSATTVALEKGEQLRSLLTQQLTAPVRFTATVRAALDLGVDQFVEFGPQGVLGALVRRILPGAATFRVGEPSDLASIAPLVAAEG